MTAPQSSDRIPSMMQTTAALTFGSPAMLGMASALAVQGYVWRMAMAGPMMAFRVASRPGSAEPKPVATQRPTPVGSVEAPKPAPVAAEAPKAAPKAAPVAAEAPKTEPKPAPVAEEAPKAAPKPAPAAAEAPKAAPKPAPVASEAPTAAPKAAPVTAEAPKAAPKPAPAAAEAPKAAPKPAPAAAEAPKAAPKAAPVASEAPKEAPKTAPAAAAAEGPVRPPALAAPRAGKGDDLTLLAGVGPKLAETLNGFGIHHFDQIAAWTPANVAWMDENLGGPGGRASRGDWVAAAAVLAGTA